VHVQEVEIDLPDTLEYFINWWGPQLAMGYEDLAAMGVVVEADPLHQPLLEHTRRMSATAYARVQFEQRDRLHRAFAKIFLDRDVLMWPTTPMVAFPIPARSEARPRSLANP
jgi:Asp-tRNA(Asn)/Glu-tRNA(Gln) amidotransferase A subunit family amidase